MTDPDLEILHQFGLLCGDPYCDASHVDIEAISGLEFTEDEPKS